MAATQWFPAATSLALFASLQPKSPWSVLQYGSEILGLRPDTFTVSLPRRKFFKFRSRYLFAIGVQFYLALEVTTSFSHCTTKQHYSPSIALLPGLSPAMAVLSITFSHPLLQRLAKPVLPSGLFRVHSQLLTKS